MAPKKKPSPDSSSGTKPRRSPRLSGEGKPRRSPRLSGEGSTPELMELPKRKKAKTTPIKSDAEEEKKPVSPVKKEESADEEEEKPVSPVNKEESADEEEKKEQSADEEEKPVSADEEEKKEQYADEEEKPVSADEEEKDDAKKRIVIEHCKSCNSFKTRAAQVKKALEEGVEGIKVVVNPEKPRKGCFEIREDGDGEVFVSLLDMKKPFKRMEDLNMEELIAEIVQKVKNED